MQISIHFIIVYARNEVQKKEILCQKIMQITLQHQLYWVVYVGTLRVYWAQMIGWGLLSYNMRFRDFKMHLITCS
ncbi:hypothetical protein MTR67_019121 [Solanum verrucosum]|uniref:Uncharacterized protein n=1 Tax=Solanum verrucosum TaxID=315347 RepID=A0AAF0QS25_SOLVR|nr:hypothetical protein MTR67_019121 [Solanum verrucosum]